MKPVTDLPTMVNPVTTETMYWHNSSEKKVRLGGGMDDYFPDDNLTQRHKGNGSNEIIVDITQAADTPPHSQR